VSRCGSLIDCAAAEAFSTSPKFQVCTKRLPRDRDSPPTALQLRPPHRPNHAREVRRAHFHRRRQALRPLPEELSCPGSATPTSPSGTPRGSSRRSGFRMISFITMSIVGCLSHGFAFRSTDQLEYTDTPYEGMEFGNWPRYTYVFARRSSPSTFGRANPPGTPQDHARKGHVEGRKAHGQGWRRSVPQARRKSSRQDSGGDEQGSETGAAVASRRVGSVYATSTRRSPSLCCLRCTWFKSRVASPNLDRAPSRAVVYAREECTLRPS
jgi:hypothetical protein